MAAVQKRANITKAINEYRWCFSRFWLSREWRKHVKTIVIQHAPQHIFNLDETPHFYNSQMKRTLALKGKKCQVRKWHKDRIMVLLCFSAHGTKKICPSIVSKFEKPHGLKALRHYPYHTKRHGWLEYFIVSAWSLFRKKRLARTGICSF